jgi:hypothetical protein
MNLTVRHYYDFGSETNVVGSSLVSDDAWDRLRLDTTLNAFALCRTRADWLRGCRTDSAAERRARDISRLLDAKRCESLISIGVGRAHLEYWLKHQNPGIELTCLEHGARTVATLRQVFTECDRIDLFDLQTGSWPVASPGTLYLLCRIDKELDNQTWNSVFCQMAEAGASDILFVATGFLDARCLAQLATERLTSLVRGRNPTFAGFIRTRTAFRQLWRPFYAESRELNVGEFSAFLLTPKRD